MRWPRRNFVRISVSVRLSVERPEPNLLKYSRSQPDNQEAFPKLPSEPAISGDPRTGYGGAQNAKTL